LDDSKTLANQKVPAIKSIIKGPSVFKNKICQMFCRGIIAKIGTTVYWI
jgi:hypothetical protein